MALIPDEFGCDVLGCSAKSIGLESDFLSETKVSDFEEAVFVQEQVLNVPKKCKRRCYGVIQLFNQPVFFLSYSSKTYKNSDKITYLWLQIAINHIFRVKILENQDDMSRIKLGRVIIKPSSIPEMSEELPANNTLHDKVKTIVVLKGCMQVHNKWMLLLGNFVQYVLFGHNVSYMVGFDNVFLSKHFDGKCLVGGGMGANADATEGTRSEGYTEVKIGDGIALDLGRLEDRNVSFRKS